MGQELRYTWWAALISPQLLVPFFSTLLFTFLIFRSCNSCNTKPHIVNRHHSLCKGYKYVQVVFARHIKSPPPPPSSLVRSCCGCYASLLRNTSRVLADRGLRLFHFHFHASRCPLGGTLLSDEAGVEDDGHVVNGEDTGGPRGALTSLTSFITVLFPLLISISSFNFSDWSHICI